MSSEKTSGGDVDIRLLSETDDYMYVPCAYRHLFHTSPLILGKENANELEPTTNGPHSDVSSSNSTGAPDLQNSVSDYRSPSHGWSRLNIDFIECIATFLRGQEISYLYRTCQAWLQIANHIRTPHLKVHFTGYCDISNFFHWLLRRHVKELIVRELLTLSDLELLALHLPRLEELTFNAAWFRRWEDKSRWIFPPQLKELNLTFYFAGLFLFNSIETISNWVNQNLIGMGQLTSLNDLQITVKPSDDELTPDSKEQRNQILSSINLHPLAQLVDSLTHLKLDIHLTSANIAVLRQLVNLVELDIYGQLSHQQLVALLAEPIPYFRLEDLFAFDYSYTNEDVPSLCRLTHLTSFDSNRDCDSEMTDLSFLAHMVQLSKIIVNIENPENLAKSLYANRCHCLTSLELSGRRAIDDYDLTLIFKRPNPMPVLKILHLINIGGITSLSFMAKLSSTLEEFSLIHCSAISISQLLKLRFFPRLHHLELNRSFSTPLDELTLTILNIDSPSFQRDWFPALVTCQVQSR